MSKLDLALLAFQKDTPQLHKPTKRETRRRIAEVKASIRAWQKLPTADGIGRPVFDDVDRFMAKVRRDEETKCWEWTGFRLPPSGYGQFGALRNGKWAMVYAHRVAYSWFQGPIPPGLTIDHLCANPGCVNPLHLEPVTQAENNRRAAARITHCKHGHEFTPENTYRSKSRGRRECRACNTRRARELRARRAQA